MIRARIAVCMIRESTEMVSLTVLGLLPLSSIEVANNSTSTQSI